MVFKEVSKVAQMKCSDWLDKSQQMIDQLGLNREIHLKTNAARNKFQSWIKYRSKICIIFSQETVGLVSIMESLSFSLFNPLIVSIYYPLNTRIFNRRKGSLEFPLESRLTFLNKPKWKQLIQFLKVRMMMMRMILPNLREKSFHNQ